MQPSFRGIDYLLALHQYWLDVFREFLKVIHVRLLVLEVYARILRSRICSLNGYLRLRLQDAKHHVQPTHVIRGDTYFVRDPRPHIILLRRKQTAYANLAWTDNAAPTENQRVCEPRSVWLEVTLPRERGVGSFDLGVASVSAFTGASI